MNQTCWNILVFATLRLVYHMIKIVQSVEITGYIWSYLPNPSARAGYDTRSVFKQSLTGLNSEFSFSSTNCPTKAEEPSLPYYLPIAGGRIIGFIPFPRVLVLCEMQSIRSRIWTRVTVSISCDDKHYTMDTSIFLPPPAWAGYDTRSIF